MKKVLLTVLFTLSIVLTAASPAHAISSIDQRYWTDAPLRQLLGEPTTKEWATNGGRMREYENGALYFSHTTGVHEVHGAIRAEFRSHGGLQVFGFPTTDEQDILEKDFSIGRENVFEHGDVTWDEVTGSHWMDAALGTAWHENIYPYLNMPTSDQEPEDTGSVIHFYDAAIHESSDEQTTITWPAWVPND